MIITLLIVCGNVKAEDYKVYNGTITQNLLRAYTNNGNVDSGFSGNRSIISTNNYVEQIGIFFDTRQYYGYKNMFYEFSGSISNSQDNVMIVNSWIANGNNDIRGTCETITNSTGQITAFTTKCFIPSGLNSGGYTNILYFQVALTRTNGVMYSTFTLNNKFAMYENYYIDKNSNYQAIINNDNQNYNDFKNSDISNDTKQQPNQQEYNNATQKENQMYNFIDTSDINILDIGDIAGWKWVLDRITEILNTNTKLLACIISILTIGVLKQLLGR